MWKSVMMATEFLRMAVPSSASWSAEMESEMAWRNVTTGMMLKEMVVPPSVCLNAEMEG